MSARILKRGDKGVDVEQLQLKLKAAGYYLDGDIDGDFGSMTEAAVFEFQADRPDVDDDRRVGPQTMGALDAAIAKRNTPPRPPSTAAVIPCALATWAAFMALVKLVTGGVKYGPGRGLWLGGKFVITYAAGETTKANALQRWPNVLGKPYPAFHCSSWTNFFLAWLLRRNELFTHGGNMPSLFDVLDGSPDLHDYIGSDGKLMRNVYRGYGPSTSPIAPDGSAIKRQKFAGIVDARELYARRASLPTFIVCGQSTKKADGYWNKWHHTVLFVVDHLNGDRMYRLAADGVNIRARGGYNAQPLRWIEITDKNVGALDVCVYKAWGVDANPDGTYGDTSKPIAEVTFEKL